jgi:hypothetical protein
MIVSGGQAACAGLGGIQTERSRAWRQTTAIDEFFALHRLAAKANEARHQTKSIVGVEFRRGNAAEATLDICTAVVDVSYPFDAPDLSNGQGPVEPLG